MEGGVRGYAQGSCREAAGVWRDVESSVGGHAPLCC